MGSGDSFVLGSARRCRILGSPRHEEGQPPLCTDSHVPALLILTLTPPLTDFQNMTQRDEQKRLCFSALVRGERRKVNMTKQPLVRMESTRLLVVHHVRLFFSLLRGCCFSLFVGTSHSAFDSSSICLPFVNVRQSWFLFASPWVCHIRLPTSLTT